MELFLFIVFIILNVLFPILALPFNFLFYVVFGKYRKIFGITIAFSLACIAYIWLPASHYDLYRWHLEANMFVNYNISDLIKHISINYEPINYIIKYVFAKVGDLNLIQFFVSYVGYSIIFWIISDYSKEKKLNAISVLVVSLLSFLIIGYINFISGLWFTLAIINFSLGIYLNYVKKTKRLHWLFYIFSVCIHMSTAYIFILMVISKVVDVKNIKKHLLIVFLIFLFIGPLLTFLNSKIDFKLFKYIYHLYDAYFIRGDRFANLHKGINLYDAFMKLALYLLIIALNKKFIRHMDKRYTLFLSMVIVSVIALIPSATIFIVRYTIFIELILIPVFLDFFSRPKEKNTLMIILLLIPFFAFLSIRQLSAINKANLNKNINNNITKNVFRLLDN